MQRPSKRDDHGKGDGMKFKFCSTCGKETWHNPLKKTKLGSEQEYRCSGCGMPKRYASKNFGLKVGGKVMFIPANG